MSAATSQNVPVFPASALVAVDGANTGDPLSFADELEPGDAYCLRENQLPLRLSFLARDDGSFFVSEESQAGSPGHALHFDSTLTFMPADGATIDAVLLVETDAQNHVAGVFVLPLAALAPKTEYRLIGIDQSTARQTFAQLACVSFSRGTHITLATGAQVPVEDLTVGSRILTRDGGAQTLRWIGQSTQRAVGDFAPIRIKASTLNNTGDLVVSPDHRLFIFQRSDQLGTGRAELLVKARHLVNGTTVTRDEGGFVDYFQLLFDAHQIIYAEGIAAESMLLDPLTKPALPDGVQERLANVISGHHSELAGLDVNAALLARPDAAEILRKASLR